MGEPAGNEVLTIRDRPSYLGELVRARSLTVAALCGAVWAQAKQRTQTGDPLNLTGIILPGARTGALSQAAVRIVEGEKRQHGAA